MQDRGPERERSIPSSAVRPLPITNIISNRHCRHRPGQSSYGIDTSRPPLAPELRIASLHSPLPLAPCCANLTPLRSASCASPDNVMATEYSSLKVPELKKLLSEKGLPQSGNKADLVARLNEHDKSAGADAAAQDDEPASKKAEPKEDEITYSDDEAPKAAAPAAVEAEPAGQEAGEKTEEGAPAAAAAAAAEEPAEDAAADATEEAAAPAAPAASYAIGLSSTAAEEEARKRAERAKRFGIDEDDDAKKRAERAARFGIDAKELASSLDSALPERPLKRGRGTESGSGNRPGKRQSLDRRGGRDGGGRRRGNDNSRSAAPAKSSGILNDPAERAKAEKRAARFAAA